MTVADNPLSEEFECAIRAAIDEVALRHLTPGADEHHVVASAWTGATFALAALAWAFKGDATLEDMADAQRAMTLSALHQIEVHEAGGPVTQ